MAVNPPVSPVRLSVVDPESLSRPLLFVKWLAAIPLYIFLAFYGIASFFAAFIAFWSILITGRCPEVLFDFLVGYMRTQYQVLSYFPLLMTDDWSPGDNHSLYYEADYPGELSRLQLLFLKLPSFLFDIVGSIAGIGNLVIFILTIPVWWIILFTGRYPRRLFTFNVNLLQWVARFNAWQWMLRDNWSLFGTTRRVKLVVGAGLIYAVVSLLATWPQVSTIATAPGSNVTIDWSDGPDIGPSSFTPFSLGSSDD